MAVADEQADVVGDTSDHLKDCRVAVAPLPHAADSATMPDSAHARRQSSPQPTPGSQAAANREHAILPAADPHDLQAFRAGIAQVGARWISGASATQPGRRASGSSSSMAGAKRWHRPHH